MMSNYVITVYVSFWSWHVHGSHSVYLPKPGVTPPASFILPQRVHPSYTRPCPSSPELSRCHVICAKLYHHPRFTRGEFPSRSFLSLSPVLPAPSISRRRSPILASRCCAEVLWPTATAPCPSLPAWGRRLRSWRSHQARGWKSPRGGG
jgi:hypothetical protein